jgi:amino-acid N-acetyltransferase
MRAAELATADDLVAITTLLKSSGLPTGDLDSSRPTFTVVRAGPAVVAAGALQAYGKSALLRSVVVAADRRGRGLGYAIVRQLEQMALALRVRRLILLTETAQVFFGRQGYRTIERDAAPIAIQRSEEFRALCPRTAICMAKSMSKVRQPDTA